MRPFLLALTGLAFCACGNDGSAPDVDPARYVGTWNVAVSQSPNCWPAFSLRFTIDQDDAAGALDHAINVVSQWWFPSLPNNKQLVSGNIDWQTDAFTFVFNRNGRTARLTGSGSDPSRLSGVITDTNEAFVTGLSCGSVAQAPATATKQ